MEFCEKLQQLRKQHELTQEQLAEKLFVSRTAVSKWESGRGYPNIDSLKCISKMFSVSIDELLSNDELIELAEEENRANIWHMSGMVFGMLDLITAAFFFLPLFGQQEGGRVRAVSLWCYAGTSGALRGVYFALLGVIAMLGIFVLAIRLLRTDKWNRLCEIASMAVSSVAILTFALSRQPYITVLLFLLFGVKVVLLVRGNCVK